MDDADTYYESITLIIPTHKLVCFPLTLVERCNVINKNGTRCKYPARRAFVVKPCSPGLCYKHFNITKRTGFFEFFLRQ